jgi:hypothetical protein
MQSGWEDMQSVWDELLPAVDEMQLTLDVAGIADPTPVCDGLNCLLYLFQGEWSEAGTSVFAMVPFIGDVKKVSRLVGKLNRIPAADKLIEAWQAVKRPLSDKCIDFINKADDITRRKLRYALQSGNKAIVDVRDKVKDLQDDLLAITGKGVQKEKDRIVNNFVSRGDEYMEELTAHGANKAQKLKGIGEDIWEIKNPGSGSKVRVVVRKLDQDLYQIMGFYPAHAGGGTETAKITRILGSHGITYP